MPPCSTTDAPGSAGASARRPASTLSSSACDQARTSTAKRPAAGTVLDVVPAVTAVGVTVVPAASSARAATRWTWWASSTVALTPFSGSSPAWAARPTTSTS